MQVIIDAYIILILNYFIISYFHSYFYSMSYFVFISVMEIFDVI